MKHEVELPANTVMKIAAWAGNTYGCITTTCTPPFTQDGEPIDAVPGELSYDEDMIIVFDDKKTIADASTQTFESIVGARPKHRPR